MNNVKNLEFRSLNTCLLQVSDWTTDFCDGTHLCTLVENLQKRPLKGWNRRPANQHHYLENASVALKAIEEDGIKLVNIGKISMRSSEREKLSIEMFSFFVFSSNFRKRRHC